MSLGGSFDPAIPGESKGLDWDGHTFGSKPR